MLLYVAQWKGILVNENGKFSDDVNRFPFFKGSSKGKKKFSYYSPGFEMALNGIPFLI